MDFVSARKAGRLLGISHQTALNWLDDGAFPEAIIRKSGAKNTIRIPLSDIENLKNKPYKEGA